jgi:hypothetical protein
MSELCREIFMLVLLLGGRSQHSVGFNVNPRRVQSRTPDEGAAARA